MSKIVVEVTGEGIHISREALAGAGIEPGTLFELSPLPGREEIVRRALAYVCWKLGDALRVGRPEWADGEWRVPIVAPEGDPQLGELFLDAEGEVIAAKAPTQDDLLKAHDAASTEASAA